MKNVLTENLSFYETILERTNLLRWKIAHTVSNSITSAEDAHQEMALEVYKAISGCSELKTENDLACLAVSRCRLYQKYAWTYNSSHSDLR